MFFLRWIFIFVPHQSWRQRNDTSKNSNLFFKYWKRSITLNENGAKLNSKLMKRRPEKASLQGTTFGSWDFWWKVKVTPASQADFSTGSGSDFRSKQWFHRERSELQVASSGGGLTWIRLTQRRHLNLRNNFSVSWHLFRHDMKSNTCREYHCSFAPPVWTGPVDQIG